KISATDYKDIVAQLKKFLEGKKDDLIKTLEKRMKRFSKKRQYEKALAVKKRIEALTAIQQLHDRSQYPIYGELDELQNALALPKIPVTIECFDISNTSGKQAVGSMVRFVAGTPRKSDYRRFKVRTVGDIDDYSMIREVVRRRYARLLEEGKALPDLVLIDGGKGHLSVAHSELTKLGIKDLNVVSIAKEHNHLYSLSRKLPIRLSPGSRLLLLVQRIRDEAHRFAITYHRRLRRTEKFNTELSEIPGIGPAREKVLIKRFGSVKNIRAASREELISSGMDKRTAGAITRYFKSKT
ncbi:MAG: helix-hairpin-helix domain-containing protein, partial [Candidatus Omnitrophota bacterium]